MPAEQPELMRLVNIEGAELSERLDYLTERFIKPQMARFRQIWGEAVERGEAKHVPFEVLFFMVTSGGGDMFASKALTERLFGSGPLEPERDAEYADQFTELIMDALRT